MIENVRGTRALEGIEAQNYMKVVNTFAQIAEKKDYKLIKLPTLEREELFARTVGEFTDIVTKQMFNFEDKKGRKLVLRPEGTAGVMRNYLEKKYKSEKKYYYSEQMFRYERPQKGRYREFHQVGAEVVGGEDDNIYSVVDITLLGIKFLTTILPKNLDFIIKVNSIGTGEERKVYQKALYEYYKSYSNELSDESKIRLDTNPLRILDSKEEKDIVLSTNAPKFNDYRTNKTQEEFEMYKSKLSKVNFVEDPSLVRGLDYYNGITFEYLPKKQTGSQDALGGGGQYDSLASFISTKQVNGVGLAFGVDRIMELI